MSKIEELAIGVRNAGFCGYLSPEQVATYSALLEAADLLTYALQVFNDTCDCGECAPCLGAQEMEATLEKLK